MSVQYEPCEENGPVPKGHSMVAIRPPGPRRKKIRKHIPPTPSARNSRPFLNTLFISITFPKQ